MHYRDQEHEDAVRDAHDRCLTCDRRPHHCDCPSEDFALGQASLGVDIAQELCAPRHVCADCGIAVAEDEYRCDPCAEKRYALLGFVRTWGVK